MDAADVTRTLRDPVRTVPGFDRQGVVAGDDNTRAAAEAELKAAAARTRAELAESVAQTALDIADRVASTKRWKWISTSFALAAAMFVGVGAEASAQKTKPDVSSTCRSRHLVVQEIADPTTAVPRRPFAVKVQVYALAEVDVLIVAMASSVDGG